MTSTALRFNPVEWVAVRWKSDSFAVEAGEDPEHWYTAKAEARDSSAGTTAVPFRDNP